MGAHKPLAFSEIADTINESRAGQLCAATIATRLSRGVRLVQRALDQLVAMRVARLYETGDAPVYEIIAPVPRGSVEGREPIERTALQIAEEEIDDGAEDEGELTSPAREALAAAHIWKERLGDQRWTDDPRALRERHQLVNLQPPFGG
jgi:hypothetical protein